MQKQSGNFLLQALLSLALIFAFMPFFAQRLAARDMSAAMYATTEQVQTASTAARIFVREASNELPYGQTVFTENDFSDTLEPYGLPLGFVPRTVLGQSVSLTVDKSDIQVSAYLELSGGELSGVQLAELARRIGFYGVVSGDRVLVGVPLDEFYSDVVRRNESSLENSAFLTDLEMGGFVFKGAGNIVARQGEFSTGQFGVLSVSGTEYGRDEKNEIDSIVANKAIFQSALGDSALSLTRGDLAVGSVDARTVSKFGTASNFAANTTSVYDFSMAAGKTGFTGGADWDIEGDVFADNIKFSVERLEIKSFIDATAGQEVYINPDSLEYSSLTGIDVDNIFVSNITMRDQTSDGLALGQAGAVILDIRPAGTSILPDVLIAGINNDSISVIKSPSDSGGDVLSCKDVILDLKGTYNSKSLSHYILCQFYFWNQLEKRINIKKCLQEGGTDCD